VELCQVDHLNLLQLAPGGHLGRFVIWTKAALARLDENWGSVSRKSATKSGYTLPRPIMLQSDLTRLINSDEIQSKVRPAIKTVRRARLKKNPLQNLGALVALNPYALALRRSEILTSTRRAALRRATIEAKRKGVKNLADLKEDAKDAPPKSVLRLSKRIAEQTRAERKADKKHRPFKVRNWDRLSGKGTPDRKPVVVEEPVAARPAAPAGAAAPAPAAAAAAAPTAKPATAKATDSKAATDKKTDTAAKPKPADKKGADADKKPADKKGDKPKPDKKGADDKKKPADKKGGDDGKGKGDKKGGDGKGKGGADKKKGDKKA